MSDRKYRHRGYMDSDRKDDDRSRGGDKPREPRPPRDLPRPGRGMERSAVEVYRCSACGTSLAPGFVVMPDSVCSSCGAALHCCRNCRYFDTSARYECRQEIPAPISSKSTGNECDLFHMRAVLDATGRRAATTGGPADPRKAFDDLFRKK